MPLTEQTLEKYDRLRGRYEEMADRVLDLDPTDPRKIEHRQRVRSAAAAYVPASEARRRTGDPDALKKIQANMRHKVQQREHRLGELKGTLSQVQATERQLRRQEQDFGTNVKSRKTGVERTEKELHQQSKRIDDEMRKADRQKILEQSRHQHEQSEARKEKLRLQAERRMRQNQVIKQSHKEEHELNFKHTKLMQQMETAARETARTERDFEDRWRRVEAEKARLKQEALETKLALDMKAKMRRKQGDEFQMEEERLRRQDRKRALEKEDREARLTEEHGRRARSNERDVKRVALQQQYSREKAKVDATREAMTGNEIRNRSGFTAEARRALEGNMEFVEQQTLLGLADERDNFAVNKAKLLELEEKFDTFCGTVAEKQAWEKSIALQVIEMKKKQHIDASKHAKSGFEKSATVYRDSLSGVRQAADKAKKQQTLVGQLEDNLSRLRAENENRIRLERLKQRKEEEMIEQQLLKEHSELTRAMCRKAGKETEMGMAAARMAEDALTVELEEEEMRKLGRIQPSI